MSVNFSVNVNVSGIFSLEFEHERDFVCLIVNVRVNLLLECEIERGYACEIDRDLVQTVHEGDRDCE